MRIRSKLFLSYILLVAVSIGFLTIISLLEASNSLEEEARKTLDHHLSSVWKQYYVRAEQMKLGMLQAASTGELKQAISSRDAGFLKERLVLWRGYRPYVDFWLIVDSSGTVLARLGQGSGDSVSFNGVVEKALVLKKPVISTELITREELQREGLSVDGSYLINGRGMAVVVATPVLREDRPVGVILTGDLLNGDPFIEQELRDVLAGSRAVLVQEGVVVSALGNGVLGMGTYIPGEVLRNAGPGASGMWISLDGEDWLMSADAIRDNRGNVLGAVVVGVPKTIFFAQLMELKRSLAITALLALGFAFILALISIEEITAPIQRLVEAAKRIRKGELGATVRTGRLHARDELGELTLVFNTMSRELKESYRSLREALEYNRSIITNAPVGIFTTDRKGRITSANPKHRELMGWKHPEEGIGLDLFSLPTIKEKGWDKLLKKALEGESVELYHEKYTSVFGKEVFINLKAVPMKRNGEIQGLLVMIEDITERIKAERRVEELSQFPERNPNPVFKVDVTGEILYHNPGVFNYVKKPEELVNLLPKGYVSLVKTACRTGREARVDHSYNGKVLDYVIYPVSSSAAHVYGRDVTERKVYEEELKKRIRELERMHRIMVGRELRMKELKNRIRELERELGLGSG